MTIVRFRYHQTDGYRCLTSGDMSGEYVPLAEYQELENKLAQATHILAQREVNKLKALIQRVVDIGPSLGGNYAWQNEELSQLLKDCGEVLK